MFAFLLLFCMPVHADDADYVDLKKGHRAPFTGKLFTNEAIAKILSNQKAAEEILKAEHEFELKKLELDLNLKYDILDMQSKSEIEMYQKMISARDDQIKSYAKRDAYQKWATYGGFILGVVTSIGIFHAVNN